MRSARRCGQRHTSARSPLGLPVRTDTGGFGSSVALVRQQLSALHHEPEVLVWFTEWGVWPSGEHPPIFERLRASYGETRSLNEIPAHVFTDSERDDLMSFVALGVLFLWDVNVIGSSGQLMLLYSHDEFVDVVGSTAVQHGLLANSGAVRSTLGSKARRRRRRS